MEAAEEGLAERAWLAATGPVRLVQRRQRVQVIERFLHGRGNLDLQRSARFYLAQRDHVATVHDAEADGPIWLVTINRN